MISILRQRLVKHTLQSSVKLKNLLSSSNDRNHLYFGYGANLSINRFTAKKMNVKELGNAYLPEHCLNFSLANEYKGKGYAGVSPKSNSKVWGALYEIDSLSLALLDALEWAGFGAYERKSVSVILENNNTTHQCWCYFVKNPVEGLNPSSDYLNAIKQTSKKRNFPNEYIDYLNTFKSKEEFQINHEFSLLFYGKKRPFIKILLPAYKFHDNVREKLSKLI